MLNDRNDKDEGQGDSEYHFSDEEANYEVGAETPKSTEAIVSKEGLLGRLNQSRRMLISLGVFIVLIFIVYKMVTPSGTASPTTVITPQAAVQPPALSNQVPGAEQNRMQAAPPVAAPVSAPMQQTATAVGSSLPAAGQPAPQQPPSSSMPPDNNQPGMSMAQATAANASVGTPQQQMPSSQPPLSTPPSFAPSVSMPAVMPVQSTVTTSYTTQQPPMQSMSPPVSVAGNVDPALIGQLQTEYVQKLNEFTAQNKTLQSQIQTLTERVSNMESQMNQLVSTLMRQNQVSSSPNTQTTSQAADQPKIPYNVQAIIPGRAWLRSDNGETVTVAEGDTIKDLGRVTKINPYDGVVEVNMGNRVVSLSYGNTES